ncbi:DUF1090 family protein [Helicobacter sp. MIT 14-3879]|uniref:DUF1090 family protein n=1 Tax=Helicobacter sp. MIT 14-3879 TaxID=2040649 RepID=UPI000E1EB986|nr:DUF1090 family protein [Helicobacter sp. MIT 14-3879]RDU65488.1 hypothetical protein CQA44_00395 [Helicobacter sp. MIT 14-3879]
MKAVIVALLVVNFCFASICKDKVEEIQEQINIAEQYKQIDKIDRLKKVLNNINEKCSNNKITDELNKKISKYESKINKAKDDIKAAKGKGKTAKQKTLELKLKSLENELEKTKEELSDYLSK